jgi:hypothetical protein
MYQISEQESRAEMRRRTNGLRSMDALKTQCNTGTVRLLDSTDHVALLLYPSVSNTLSNQGGTQGFGMGHTSGSCVVIVTSHRAIETRTELLSPAAMVKTAMDTFSLSVSDAAAVFFASRPTIYQWLETSDISMIRSALHRRRIKDLYHVAALWSKNAKLTGNWLEAILPGGRSVKDMLANKDIDTQAVLQAHALLYSSNQQRRKIEHQKVAATVPKLKSAFKKLGEKQKRHEEAV